MLVDAVEMIDSRETECMEILSWSEQEMDAVEKIDEKYVGVHWMDFFYFRVWMIDQMYSTLQST